MAGQRSVVVMSVRRETTHMSRSRLMNNSPWKYLTVSSVTISEIGIIILYLFMIAKLIRRVDGSGRE
jgi:hypothetical protein